MSSPHDQWLANYHTYPTTVYCGNPECANAGGITVTFESEYGQGTITPEDCPACGTPLQDTPPTTEEER